VFRVLPGLFPPFIFSSRHFVCISYLFHGTCFLDLIILIIFAEKYKLWNSSLWSSLQSPPTSFFLGPVLKPFQYVFSLMLETKCFTRMQSRWNYNFVCFNLCFRQQTVDNGFWAAWLQAIPEFRPLLLSLWINFFILLPSLANTSFWTFPHFPQHFLLFSLRFSCSCLITLTT
jgi:hypothetical protein